MPDSVNEIPPDARTEFRPGWPALFPGGLIIARSTATPMADQDDVEAPEDDKVQWVMHLGARSEHPRLALVGDLIVTNPFAFSGVTVYMPFELRDEPDDLEQEYLDGVLSQYGEWASSIMYDHAAAAMRTMLAGNGLALTVPFGTPQVELHTSKVLQSIVEASEGE